MGDLQLDIFNRSWYAKNSEIGMYTMYTLSEQTLSFFPLLFLDMTDPQKTSSSKKHLTSLCKCLCVAWSPREGEQ